MDFLKNQENQVPGTSTINNHESENEYTVNKVVKIILKLINLIAIYFNALFFKKNIK